MAISPSEVTSALSSRTTTYNTAKMRKNLSASTTIYEIFELLTLNPQTRSIYTSGSWSCVIFSGSTHLRSRKPPQCLRLFFSKTDTTSSQRNTQRNKTLWWAQLEKLQVKKMIATTSKIITNTMITRVNLASSRKIQKKSLRAKFTVEMSEPIKRKLWSLSMKKEWRGEERN